MKNIKLALLLFIPFALTSIHTTQTQMPTNTSSLRDEIATLRNDLTTLAKQRNQVRNKLLNALGDSPEAQALKESIASLGRQIGGVSGNRTKIRNTLANLFGTKHGTIPGLKQKLTQFNTTLNKIGQEKRNLEAQLDKMYTNEELQKLNDTITEIGNSIRKRESELDSILMAA